jgi:hypothetical protein
MSWPSGILPDYRVGDPPEDHLKRVTGAVREVQRILQGGVSIAGVGADERPNALTNTVDLVLDQETNNEINNPLGTEPIGIIPLIAPGIVMPRWDLYDASVNVVADSTVVTTRATFAADMALGYLVARGEKVKILSWVDAATLTLYEPWPGTSGTNVNASIMYRWDADTVWLYCGGTFGYPGFYRLMFF